MLITHTKSDGKKITLRLKSVSHAPPVTFGRGDDATVTIDDAKCSRIHAAIRYWDDIFIVRDMHSSNGTFLNGEKIDVALLCPGDVIKIGDTEFQADTEAGSADVTMRT